MYQIEQISMPDKIAYIQNNVAGLPTLTTTSWPASQMLQPGQPIVFTTTTPTAMPAAPTASAAAPAAKDLFDANASQAFCLRWNNYQVNLLSVFDQLLKSEQFVDVTLACDGAFIKAHKMVLSACSPYFQALLAENPCQHPVVIMKDIRFHELKAIVDFMYKGEINVVQEQIGPLLRVAETLKIRGLADVSDNNTVSQSTSKSYAQPVVTTATVPMPMPTSTTAMAAETLVGMNLVTSETGSSAVAYDNNNYTAHSMNGHAEEQKIQEPTVSAAMNNNIEGAASLKTPRKTARSGKRSALVALVAPENLTNGMPVESNGNKKAKAIKVETTETVVTTKAKATTKPRTYTAGKKNYLLERATLDAKEETNTSETSTNDDDNQVS